MISNLCANNLDYKEKSNRAQLLLEKRLHFVHGKGYANNGEECILFSELPVNKTGQDRAVTRDTYILNMYAVNNASLHSYKFYASNDLAGGRCGCMEATISTNNKFEVNVDGSTGPPCFCNHSKVYATNTLVVEEEGFYTSFKLKDHKNNLKFQCNLIGENYLK